MTGLQWCEGLQVYRCRQCWDLHRRWSSKGRPRERTQAECDKWRQKLEEKGSAASHECENCHVVKGDPAAPKQFTKMDTGYLCMLCHVYMNKYKKLRSTGCNEYNEIMENLRFDRKNGVNIICSWCDREDGILSRPHVLSKKPPYERCFVSWSARQGQARRKTYR